MNFLAHIFLSGDDEELIIGNFIADSVKGKKYLEFPPGIQKGILLHRAIDYYTDTHPVVRRSTSRLFPSYSHYSAVIVDIYYDHFLAANWNHYSEIPLQKFVTHFYQLLQENFSLLPGPIQRFLPIMVQEDWLFSYSSIEGIERILFQMNIRTQGKSRMDQAVTELIQEYELFKADFISFFPDLQTYCSEKVKTIE